MVRSYDHVDAATRTALMLKRGDLLERLDGRATVFSTNNKLISAFAERILTDYQDGLDAGRDQVAMIVPVGPVGQYSLLSERCRRDGISLKRLTLFLMDEYLTDEGRWIPESDPLSFRAHIRKRLIDPLPESLRPSLVIPDPTNPEEVGHAIERLGGVDVTFAGVGITGHLAFNEPIPDVTSVEYFSNLSTRVVSLLTETRLINSVTAARGNVARIPRMAVTVGMREILGARRLRILLNRTWQSAVLRRMACGPVTTSFPASLAQHHADWSVFLVDHVLDEPEPELA